MMYKNTDRWPSTALGCIIFIKNNSRIPLVNSAKNRKFAQFKKDMLNRIHRMVICFQELLGRYERELSRSYLYYDDSQHRLSNSFDALLIKTHHFPYNIHKS